MSKIVHLNDFKNSKDDNNKNDAFKSALDRLSKQNGVSYEKMLLGSINEKKIERNKLNKKMKLTQKEIELMEG